MFYTFLTISTIIGIILFLFYVLHSNGNNITIKSNDNEAVQESINRHIKIVGGDNISVSDKYVSINGIITNIPPKTKRVDVLDGKIFFDGEEYKKIINI